MPDEAQNASKPPDPDPRQTVDSSFRSGTLTAISVVLGFSLSFLTRWAGYPGDWSAADLVGLAVITAGIAMQVWSLARILSFDSLVLVNHERIVRMFLAGLILVAVGVLLAIWGALIGYGQHVLAGSA